MPDRLIRFRLRLSGHFPTFGTDRRLSARHISSAGYPAWLSPTQLAQPVFTAASLCSSSVTLVESPYTLTPPLHLSRLSAPLCDMKNAFKDLTPQAIFCMFLASIGAVLFVSLSRNTDYLVRALIL